MRIFVLTLSTVSALAWVNPFGMYNTSATSALNMVPPAEVHADALKYKCEDIQAAFAAGTDTSNSSLKFKTIPGVDVKGHHLWRCADNQTTLSDLQAHTQGPDLLLPGCNVSFHFALTVSNAVHACLPSARTLLVHATVLFARARIRACILGALCADVLQDMMISCVRTLGAALGLVASLVVCLCACAVCLDVALAVLGFMLLIVSAPPTTHAHVISCIMVACMRMIRSPLMIKVVVFVYTTTTLVHSSLAAGAETPSVNPMEYVLPGVTKWDGIPYHEFRLVWWLALCTALGNISQDGWSLLQTARDQDEGGPSNPGTAAQRLKSSNRNQRLFGAILNYIEPTSTVYRYVSRSFANNGRGLFNYLYVVGHLAYTSDERTVMENEWTEATMATVGIKYTWGAVFKWAEYVDRLAEKLNKSERDKRVKYLAGFPSSFDVMIVPERARGAVGNYTHPANYPAHHPNAGNAHPLAGQPDIHAIAQAFYSEWARMIRTGAIKSVPRGMANRIEEETSDGETTESANMVRDRITPHTVCAVCGGAGHAGNVEGLGMCLTARLNHRVPNSDLAQFRYPQGYTPPRFNSNQPRSNPNPNRRVQDALIYPLGPPRPYPHSNSQPKARVRFTEPTDHTTNWTDERFPSWDDEPDEQDQEFAARLHADHHSRARQQKRNGSTGASRPRPNPYRSRPSRPSSSRARHVERESDGDHRDEQQNVNTDADSNDEDEHARLAVNFEAIKF